MSERTFHRGSLQAASGFNYESRGASNPGAAGRNGLAAGQIPASVSTDPEMVRGADWNQQGTQEESDRCGGPPALYRYLANPDWTDYGPGSRLNTQRRLKSFLAEF